MDYAYIYYPARIKIMADHIPLIKYLPQYLAEKARPYYSPVLDSLIIDAAIAQGGAIACAWPIKKRIMESIKIAVEHGSKIIGIQSLLLRESCLKKQDFEDIETPIAMGDMAALYAALEAVRLVIKSKGLSYNKTRFLIIGTHLPLGRLIVRILAREAKYITLIGSFNTETDKLFSQVMYETGLALKFSQLPEKTIKTSDIVITASRESFFSVDSLAPGTILCDLTVGQIKSGSDIITIQNPGYTIPQEFEALKMTPLLLDTIPASLIEVIIANLENEYELFSHQREMTINQVDKAFGLIKKYGFSVMFPAKAKKCQKP